MGKFKSVSFYCVTCVLAAMFCAVSLPSFGADDARRGIEEVVVTAERRASTVQDTAIAISAFDGDALELRQVDTTSDLQFNVPNMLVSKTNFTASNIAFRAVDGGGSVNINEQYLVAPAIFESEFFDLERIEVLRGPQGTLYGRNTTGGIINLITRRPEMDSLGGDVNVELGNYSSRKIYGALNLPITNRLATRLAFYSLDRDGYTDNLYTGNDIDDRDLWQARLTTDFEFSENTRASLMVQHFKEDDRRARVSKQLCTKDDRGVFGFGCLPDSKTFETLNDQATIQTALIGLINANAAYSAAVGGPALPAYGPQPSAASAAKISYDFGLKAGFQQGLAAVVGDAAATALVDSYDALGFDAAIPAVDRLENSLNPPDLRKVYADFDPEFFIDETIASLEITHHFGSVTLTSLSGYGDYEYWGLTDYDWAVPTVQYLIPVTYKVDGRDRVATFSEGVDRSGGVRDQWSQQFTLVSELPGRFNYTAGVNYLDYESDTHYNVYASDLSAYSALGGYNSVLNTITGGLVAAPPLPEERSMYDSHTIFFLKTWAAFGELYFDIDDRTEITLGLRYTDEEQRSIRQLFYVDLSSGAILDQEADWQEITGKISVDRYISLEFTDETLMYVSLARGFKSGGFNSPSTIPGLYSDTFEPENVDTYEFGAKNRLLDNRVQANIAVFYNDYNDMQVTQIVNQSAVQVNTDSKITGLEAEMMFAPNDRWMFGLNIALLDSEIKDFSTVDPANPTQGAPLLNIFGNIYDAATGQRGNTEVSLDGNELSNAPDYSVNFFADYTQPLSNGMLLAYHIDYFTQSDYYARDFNTPADKVESWDVANASITLSSAAEDWSARLWIKNIQDDDNVTGHYITDAVSGLFTNEFVLEPRTFGLSFTKRW